MSHIVLQLPYPPSANKLWTRTRRGMRRTDAYLTWLEEAGWMAREQRQKPLHGLYKLSIQAVRPDKRRRDLDNIIKPTSDLLQYTKLVDDDCHCELISARWVTTGQGM